MVILYIYDVLGRNDPSTKLENWTIKCSVVRPHTLEQNGVEYWRGGLNAFTV